MLFKLIAVLALVALALVALSLYRAGRVDATRSQVAGGETGNWRVASVR